MIMCTIIMIIRMLLWRRPYSTTSMGKGAARTPARGPQGQPPIHNNNNNNNNDNTYNDTTNHTTNNSDSNSNSNSSNSNRNSNRDNYNKHTELLLEARKGSHRLRVAPRARQLDGRVA